MGPTGCDDVPTWKQTRGNYSYSCVVRDEIQCAQVGIHPTAPERSLDSGGRLVDETLRALVARGGVNHVQDVHTIIISNVDK